MSHTHALMLGMMDRLFEFIIFFDETIDRLHLRSCRKINIYMKKTFKDMINITFYLHKK